jgi:hypothetical protein
VAGLGETRKEHINRDACWLLIATLACCGVILPLQIGYALVGTANPVYLYIISLVTLANILALKLCQRKSQVAVLIFSWIMLVAILGMLAIDAIVRRDTFPGITNLLAIIAMGTAYIVGLKRAAPHIIVDVIALAWMSTLYGISDTVPILAACTIGGALVGRLRDELCRNRKRADMTEAAIETYARIKNGG